MNKEELIEKATKNMRQCNHIWFTSEIVCDFDGHRTGKTTFYTCVKCGLDTHCKEKVALNIASDLNKKMALIIDEMGLNGIKTDIVCSKNLITGIYEGLLRAHPGITDDEIVKYLKCALNNIRGKEVTDNVKNKRILRLGLYPNFKKWDKKDVIK